MNDREKWRERVRDIRATARHDDDEVFLSNINNFQTFIWPIEGTHNLVHSEPRINSNEEVYNILQHSRTGASLLDAVWSHTQDNC